MTGVEDILGRRILKFKRGELPVAIEALRRMQGIPGVDVAGARAKEMQRRFELGDTSIDLRDFNTLGFALSRLDSKQGYKLLDRLTKCVVEGKDEPSLSEMLKRAASVAWARAFGRADKTATGA